MKQTFLFLSLLIGTCACQKVDNKKLNVETSGSYLYRDRYGVVHDERDCTKMLNCDEKFGIWLFVKKGEVKKWRHHLEYFCNVCISDNDYEGLMDIDVVPDIVYEDSVDYEFRIDNKSYTVSRDEIEENGGMSKFAEFYPDATIRMKRDDDGKEFDIPVSEYEWAMGQGMRPWKIKRKTVVKAPDPENTMQSSGVNM